MILPLPTSRDRQFLRSDEKLTVDWENVPIRGILLDRSLILFHRPNTIPQRATRKLAARETLVIRRP